MKIDKDIVDEIEEAMFEKQFAELRMFFQRPLPFSHNYGQFELRHQRECLTIDLGKKLLPGFTEDRILEIARSRSVDLDDQNVQEV